ncbi:putative 2-isopropylmalate synthase [Dirofilaria immitis]
MSNFSSILAAIVKFLSSSLKPNTLFASTVSRLYFLYTPYALNLLAKPIPLPSCIKYNIIPPPESDINMSHFYIHTSVSHLDPECEIISRRRKENKFNNYTSIAKPYEISQSLYIIDRNE